MIERMKFSEVGRAFSVLSSQTIDFKVGGGRTNGVCKNISGRYRGPTSVSSNYSGVLESRMLREPEVA